MPLRPRRTVDQLAAAVGAYIVEGFGARRAESAFEAADEGAGRLGREVRAATLAIGAHLEHSGGDFLHRIADGVDDALHLTRVIAFRHDTDLRLGAGLADD